MNSMEYDYENDIIKNNEYEFNDTIIKKVKIIMKMVWSYQ